MRAVNIKAALSEPLVQEFLDIDVGELRVAFYSTAVLREMVDALKDLRAGAGGGQTSDHAAVTTDPCAKKQWWSAQDFDSQKALMSSSQIMKTHVSSWSIVTTNDSSRAIMKTRESSQSFMTYHGYS